VVEITTSTTASEETQREPILETTTEYDVQRRLISKLYPNKTGEVMFKMNH